MANKFGKFLTFVAVAGAAAVGGVALYNKYKNSDNMLDDDFDFDDDDFDDDFSDIESENGREYVSIPLDSVNASSKEDTEKVTEDATDAKADAKDTKSEELDDEDIELIDNEEE